jgi:hypothetical protein
MVDGRSRVRGGPGFAVQAAGSRYGKVRVDELLLKPGMLLFVRARARSIGVWFNLWRGALQRQHEPWVPGDVTRRRVTPTTGPDTPWSRRAAGSLPARGVGARLCRRHRPRLARRIDRHHDELSCRHLVPLAQTTRHRPRFYSERHRGVADADQFRCRRIPRRPRAPAAGNSDARPRRWRCGL